MVKRPKLYPEKLCKPLWNMMGEDYLAEGGSRDCVGILKESVVEKYDTEVLAV